MDQPLTGGAVLLNGRRLAAAPGLKLDGVAIPSLGETVSRNNVTSDDGFETAPYTERLL